MNREPGIRAELAKIGGTAERFDPPYRVLIDRISQEVDHYRLHLKAAQLAYWDTSRKAFVVEQESVRLLIGASSADVRLRAETAVQ